MIAIDPKNPSIVWVGTGENNNQRSVSYGDGVYKQRRWRAHLAQRRPQAHRAHRAHRDRPARFQRGLRRRPGSPLEGRRRARALQNHRRRQDLVGRASSKSASTPAAPTCIWTRAIPTSCWPPPISGSAVLRHDPRRAGKRPVALHRRRQDLDRGARRIPHRRARPHRPRTTRPPTPTSSMRRWKAPKAAAALYRSTDNGVTWEKRNSYDQQGQYYSKVQVDPADPDRVYIHDVNIMVSDDGGRTLAALPTRNKHVDNHDIWVDPKNNNHYLVGCDGGLYESYDRAASWIFKANLPTGADVRRHGERRRAVLPRLRRHPGQQQLRLRRAHQERCTCTTAIALSPTAATVSIRAWTPRTPTPSTPTCRTADWCGSTSAPASASPSSRSR